MPKLKLKGILIKFFEYGDSSLIYRFFTAEHAIIGVLAKGIRKKPDQQQLIPFCVYELSVYEPREPGLWIFAEASLMQDYSTFPSSATWATAACGMELISQMILPHEEQLSTYNMAISYLEYLQNIPDNAVLIFWRFLNRIIILSGIGNPLAHCSLCHKETGIFQAVFIREGNLVCSECYAEASGNDNLMMLSPNSSRILQLLPEIARHLQELKLCRKDLIEINTIFEGYWLTHHKQALKLKSLSVLVQFYPIA